MAIYHFSAKLISRAKGASALAAAAYRSASRLRDTRLERHHDFSNKAGVVHSEVLLPDGAPGAWQNREALWNAVEAVELRKDAQLAREVEFAIPRELDQAEGIRLARDFVERAFVARGMVADLNVHWDIGVDGEPKPHAHVMLTTRAVLADGFGAKMRDWNRTELLGHWREAWAAHVNQRLADLDIDARIDHRSLEAQGIDLEPQTKLGAAASRMLDEGRASERLAEHHAIARSNGEKILAKPSIALDAITHGQATFTTRDLARFVHRHSDDKEQFDHVMAAVRSAPELVALGKDGRGEERFTSRAMLEAEQRLERAADGLALHRRHGLPATAWGMHDAAVARSDGIALGSEQQAALAHLTGGADLAIVIGYAGTGKSTMLGVSRKAWEQAGYQVQGAALSGIAAENLENGSGIASRTIASLEHQWGQGRDLLDHRSILVIDEAGMIGTHQMERVISEAHRRQAKVVLVGDPEQLQAIEAGAAFRRLAERHGSVEITTVRRQKEAWQREATRQLATGRTQEAIDAYDQAGHVHAAATREAARAELIERWDKARVASPGAGRIILTHTHDEVQRLNEAARRRLRDAGELGENMAVTAERGARSFAAGDRVMFLRNERGLGVKNGSLGTVQGVTALRMAVLLDNGQSAAFEFRDYAHIDHGYAATIHKAQGMTVDQVHVLATPGLDRHAAYVALSRHRDRVDLHYGRDDFADRDKLTRTLGRDRAKDMATDYATPTTELEDVIAPTSPLDRAVLRHAHVSADILASQAKGLARTPHQQAQLDASRAAFEALRPDSARYLEEAMKRDPSLGDVTIPNRSAVLLAAMQAEIDYHASGQARADRFVAQWTGHLRRIAAYERKGESWRGDEVRRAMSGMVKELQRDPQLESLLRNRRRDLGIKGTGGMSIAQDLQQWIGRSRGLGIGM